MSAEAMKFKPDPSVHSDPEVLAICPVCNPKPAPAVDTTTFSDPPRGYVVKDRRIAASLGLDFTTSTGGRWGYCTTGELVLVPRRRR